MNDKEFDEIFQNAFLRVSNSIDLSGSLEELCSIQPKDYKYVFILELMKYFEKKYSVDVLSMYIHYLDKCSHSFIMKFSQLCESCEGL